MREYRQLQKIENDFLELKKRIEILENSRNLSAPPTIKISEMIPAGSALPTDLLEISRPLGGGNFDTFSVTKANIAPIGNSYAPALTSLSGITGSPTLAKAFYKPDSILTGGMVFGAVEFTATADASNNLMAVNIGLPIATNFTAKEQVILAGFSIIKSSNVNSVLKKNLLQKFKDFLAPSPGAIGDGWKNDLFADVTNNLVTVQFEGATPSVEYLINVAFLYQLQP